MTAPEKKTGEVYQMSAGISGIGRAGDAVVYNPSHPNPAFRLCSIHRLDPTRLAEFKERIEQANDAQEARIQAMFVEEVAKEGEAAQ